MASVNLSILHRFIEFINSGDVKIGEEVISASALFHVPFEKAPVKGLEGYLQILNMLRSGFPDIKWVLQETVSEGEQVVARFEASGTHKGSFLTFPASGAAVKMSAINIYRFQNGKIVAEIGQPDLFGVFMQIGAFPNVQRNSMELMAR